MPMPISEIGAHALETSRPPSHGTTVSTHGFMLSYAVVPRPLTQFRSAAWKPKTVSIADGSGFVRPFWITVYMGMSTMNCSRVGRQPLRGLTPRDL